MVLMKNETEKAYPRQSTEDKDEEYSYLFTECGNWWYSVKKDPMIRDDCICPKCGRTVKVVIGDVYSMDNPFRSQLWRQTEQRIFDKTVIT